MTTYANASNYVKNTGAIIEIKTAMNDLVRAEFDAFVTSFNDSFTSQWSTENVYGRQDPIGTFQSTTRTISLGFDIVAFSRDDAKVNMLEINKLINMLYPTYSTIEEQPNALALSKAPLVEIKYANLIHENGDPLLGWISSFSANPALDMGMFTENKKLFPKVYNATLTFNPQHRDQLGFTKDQTTGRVSRFPYDGDL
jgi:hypothetical protein